MFIRKTKHTDLKTNRKYFTYQLVESVRTPKGPRQRILLTIGTNLSLPEENHKELAHRIEEIVSGQIPLFLPAEHIETLAQKYASELIRRLSDQPQQDVHTDIPSSLTDYETIDVNTIEQQEPRTVGNEHLLMQIADQLELPKVLRQIGLSEREVSLALGTILGRAIHPASERATYTWLNQKSGLGELLGFDFENASLDRFYEISDTLLKNKSVLEEHLRKRQEALHGYKKTMILYDLTNTYMEGSSKGNSKAKYGVSKEKRKDCPLVTLGLVIDEYGFPIRTEFLPGNVSEPKSLEQAIEALFDHSELLKPTVILDAGIATDDNLKWLREHNYTYIVSARQKPSSMELDGELVAVGDLEKSGVKAALIKTSEIDEKWLYCESEAKKKVSSEMKLAFQKRFEDELSNLSSSLQKPKGRKNLNKIHERIGRLKEKHSRVSGCYEITVTPSEDKKTALAVDWKLISEKLDARLNEYYFLRTNLLNQGVKELWSLYGTLRKIEDSFRFMKSSLGMRPVYHQKEARVDGHLWITVLAFYLIQNCLYQLKQQGLSLSWETIRERMSNRERITMKAQTKEGKTLYHRSTTKAELDQQKIYKALGLSSVILRSKKIML